MLGTDASETFKALHNMALLDDFVSVRCAFVTHAVFKAAIVLLNACCDEYFIISAR